MIYIVSQKKKITKLMYNFFLNVVKLYMIFHICEGVEGSP